MIKNVTGHHVTATHTRYKLMYSPANKDIFVYVGHDNRGGAFPGFHGVPRLQNSNLHNSFSVKHDSSSRAINTPIVLSVFVTTLQSNCIIAVGQALFCCFTQISSVVFG